MTDKENTATIREQKIGPYTAYLMELQLENSKRYAVMVPKFGQSSGRTTRFGCKVYYSHASLVEASTFYAKTCGRLAENEAKKAERRTDRLTKVKQERAEAMASIKVGDLFCRSWGYNMTINDFYVVTEVKPKSLIVSQLGGKTLSGGGYSGQEVVDVGCVEKTGIRALPSRTGIIVNGDYAGRTTVDEKHYYNTMD